LRKHWAPLRKYRILFSDPRYAEDIQPLYSLLHCNTCVHTCIHLRIRVYMRITHCNTHHTLQHMCTYLHTSTHMRIYTYHTLQYASHTATHVYIQPIAFRVSLNLKFQSQAHWSLFHGTWQKRPRHLDHQLRFENEEILQPFAFVVSFNLILTSQSNWSLFNGTWQK